MQGAINALLILGAMLACGFFIGLGIALGMEAAMRMSREGRTVILTFARTRTESHDD